MRIVFLGSGAFGLPTLEALHVRHDVRAVVTQPDRPAGRQRKLTPTPVAQWAQQQGIDVIRTDDVNTPEMIEQVRALQPQAGVVIAFGQKLSPPLIEAMGTLAINLHGSLVPRYRGAAPINHAIMAGEQVTGVSVIGLAQRMDAGAIYARRELPIDPTQTAGEVHDELAQLGPDAVIGVLERLQHGTLEPLEQDEAQATRAPKLSKAEGTVDFALPAEQVRARVHGLTPWPGCHVQWACHTRDEQRRLTLRRVQAMPVPDFLKQAADAAEPGTVLESLLVKTGQGVVRLLELQGPGTRIMAADAFARGHDLKPGDRLAALNP